MSKAQHEMMLRQQLSEIQAQLGESSPEQVEVAELRRRMRELSLPDLVRKEIDKELSRLERMSANSPDYQTSRSYVDLILDMPSEKSTEDNLDLVNARAIVDEDDFDLQEVKDRIVEHLLGQHILWGTMLLMQVFHGPGKLSMDHLLQHWRKA
ncbi:MAG: hypothetical protein LJE59_14800 [Chromatiaceae bacterium]|nr:hypothetical protein [Chromatiaceae bacterium]